MAVPAVVSAVGLAVLIAAPGQPVREGEEPVPGAGSLYVTVQGRAEEPLRAGDRVEYTIRVRNAGYEAVPEAQVVQYLPPSMRYVSGAPEGAEAGRAEWDQPLEPGERAVLSVTAELTETPGRGRQPVTTVCLRPGAEAQLASCASSVHQVHRVLPFAWVAAGLLLVLSAAVAVGGFLRYRGTRKPRPAPEAPGGPGPDPVVDIGAPSERAPVYHLDAHR
ncbi:hypothetical protein ACWFMI_17620 [Nocardiopsis terrae]